MCMICAETIAAGVAAVTVGAAYLKIQIDKKKLEQDEECQKNPEKKSS